MAGVGGIVSICTFEGNMRVNFSLNMSQNDEKMAKSPTECLESILNQPYSAL